MESEEQINRDQNAESVAADELSESLYPDPPIQPQRKSNSKRLFGNQGLYPSKPASKAVSANKSNSPNHELPYSEKRPNRKAQPSSYYHPNDYYLGTDWPRLVVGTLASLILLVSVGILALYLFDRFDSETAISQNLVVSSDEAIIINAYLCAGDSTPVKQIETPPSALFSGRNASGTWIAFQDPMAPSVQLWSRTTDLLETNLEDLQVVNCENLPNSEDTSDS